MRKLIYLMLSLFTISLSSCIYPTTPPPNNPAEITQQTIFNKNYNDVWQATVEVVGELYPIKVVEKTSGFIATDMVSISVPELNRIGFRRKLKSLLFFDSGRYSLNILIKEVNQNATRVKIVPHIEGFFSFEHTFGWRIFQSRGIVEEELFGKIQNKFLKGKIGIAFITKEGWPIILKVETNSPAYKAGLKVGDWIYKIDGKITKGISPIKLSNMIKGEPDTEVTITIRKGRKEVDYKILRKK